MTATSTFTDADGHTHQLRQVDARTYAYSLDGGPEALVRTSRLRALWQRLTAWWPRSAR